jgi:hypothetical protein
LMSSIRAVAGAKGVAVAPPGEVGIPWSGRQGGFWIHTSEIANFSLTEAKPFLTLDSLGILPQINDRGRTRELEGRVGSAERP